MASRHQTAWRGVIINKKHGMASWISSIVNNVKRGVKRRAVGALAWHQRLSGFAMRSIISSRSKRGSIALFAGLSSPQRKHISIETSRGWRAINNAVGRGGRSA